MRFEFTPSKNIESFNEYMSYILGASIMNKIYGRCHKISLYISTFLMLSLALSRSYIHFFYNLKISCIAIIVAILVYFLIYRLAKARKRKKLKKSGFCDINSTFNIIIEDNFLIRENEFSTIKIPLEEISEINLLKNGLVLESELSSISILIPKDSLPVSLNEFLRFFKKDIVNEYSNKNSKSIKRYGIIIALSILISVTCSFFIAKYKYDNNFVSYNLVTEAELEEKSAVHSYLYENSKLGIGIYFPKTWNGHYGIEEVSNDEIKVYYLVDGKQSSSTTLLFTMRKEAGIKEDKGFNFIRYANNGNGFYTILAPKEISTLKDKSPEYEEYVKMFKNIERLQFK